ncbi:MAG: chaperone NapD [Euryarchaeota archaeon]|nr:chaperone NapD [Euryarchaeota archaeon]
MPVSGAVVVPVPGREAEVERLLRSMRGIEVMGRGSGGIAITLEGSTTRELYSLSEHVEKLEDVVDFQLVYLNVEDEVEE